MTSVFTPVPKPPKKNRSKKDNSPKIERIPTANRPRMHLERDEFELEELATILNESKEDGQIKEFFIYRKNEGLKGRVTSMDPNTKLIHITDSRNEVHKIHFLDILKVNNVD